MNVVKLHNSLYNRLCINSRRSISFLSKKNETENPEEIDTTPTFLEDEINLEEKERELEQKRNVSRLLPQHRNVLQERVPYARAESWIHETAKYKRMMFGRYGLESGVDPAICFMSKAEIVDQQEYEKVAYPFTLKEMIEENKRQKKARQDAILERDEKIAKKLEKLEQWKKELYSKIAKKESDAKAARDRKDRLVEEVRRHFGYKVDPREEKFKEMLEQKEKEDKKRMKEEKRKVKEAKMISKISKTDSQSESTQEQSENLESSTVNEK